MGLPEALVFNEVELEAELEDPIEIEAVLLPVAPTPPPLEDDDDDELLVSPD
jgi:hypothetical protein